MLLSRLLQRLAGRYRQQQMGFNTLLMHKDEQEPSLVVSYRRKKS